MELSNVRKGSADVSCFASRCSDFFSPSSSSETRCAVFAFPLCNVAMLPENLGYENTNSPAQCSQVHMDAYGYMMLYVCHAHCTCGVFGGIFLMSHKTTEHEIAKGMQKKTNTAMTATTYINTYIEPRLLHRVKHDETCSLTAAEMNPFSSVGAV